MKNPFRWQDELYLDVESGELCLFRTHWNVCFGWALWQWITKGGYLVLRRARLCVPIWHFMWMEEEGGPLYHFVPINEDTRIPWPIFKGRIKKGEWNVLTHEKDRKYRRVIGPVGNMQFVSYDQYI